MTSRRQSPRKVVPNFANREEEAKFWETHDISDYWEAMQPVRARFAKRLSAGITIRFDAETLGELRLAASKRGIGPTTLARMWVLEHLHEEAAPRRQTRQQKVASR